MVPYSGKMHFVICFWNFQISTCVHACASLCGACVNTHLCRSGTKVNVYLCMNNVSLWHKFRPIVSHNPPLQHPICVVVRRCGQDPPIGRLADRSCPQDVLRARLPTGCLVGRICAQGAVPEDPAHRAPCVKILPIGRLVGSFCPQGLRYLCVPFLHYPCYSYIHIWRFLRGSWELRRGNLQSFFSAGGFCIFV